MTDLEDFKQAVMRGESTYKGATLSLALEVKEDSRHILRGVMRFTDNDAQPEQCQDYGRLLLCRKSLTCAESVGLVEAAVNGEKLPGFETAPRQLQFQRGDWKNYESLPTPIGFQRLSEWPADEFMLKSNASSSDPSEPLVKPDLPLAVYPSQAIDEWIGANQDRHRIQGGIAVVLPDFRARISKIRFAPDSISVTVETRLSVRDSLALKAAVDGEEVEIEEAEGLSDFRIPIKNLPSNFHFFVLDRETGDTIDWARVYLSWTDLPPEIEFSSPGQQLERLIAAGESKTLEFKKERGNGFTLMQSIVAFANTDGGMIVVGVDDDATIVGTDPVGDEDRIREWVESKCDPPIDLTFDEALLEERKVLAVHVPKGLDPPYVLRDNNGVYVRRGSTDRRASRSELMTLATSGQSSPGIQR